MELSILTPEEGFHGIRGCESEMEQGLASESGCGGSGTFKASMASPSLVNTFWVR